MNKDTVVLSNIYSLIGYSYVDKYLGELTGRLTENGYEQTPVDNNIIKEKIRADFTLNNNNSYFYRNDTFAVKTMNVDGKKNVILHCISYPQKYILDIDSDKKEAPKIDRNELINIK